MSPISFFSTHTGANGSGCGAIAAGLVDVGGIEIEPYPVQLYLTGGHGNGRAPATIVPDLAVRYIDIPR